MRRPEPLTLVAARPVVLIDGRRRNDVEAALALMELRLPRHGMAHVELRLLAAPTPEGHPFGDVAHGSRIAIGYGSERPAPLFEGDVTAIEIRMGDGPPELAILAEDALHRLARRMRPQSFEEMSADDVVRSLAAEVGLEADATLGGRPGSFVKGAESDLAFLLRLTAAYGAALRLEKGRVRAGPEAEDATALPLDAGTLAGLRIVADLNWLPGAVTVRGWDLASGAPVEATTAPPSAPAPLQSGVELTAKLGWAADRLAPRDFSGSGGAKATAAARSSTAAERFLHGEIVAAEPGLVPGAAVEISGTDPRFAGRYRVGDCRHRFSVAEGLRVRAGVHRPDWRP